MTPIGVLLPDGIMMWSVIAVFTGAPKSGPMVGPLLPCGMQLGVLGSAISSFMNCTLDLGERRYILHLEYRKMIERYIKT